MMDLREYLFRNRVTCTDFSKTLQCDRTYLGKIANGQCTPGKRLAKDIERETGGSVLASDLMKNHRQEK